MERKPMKRCLLAATAAALVVPALAFAQGQLPTKEPAAKPAAPAPREGPVATVSGVAIPRQRADFVVRQQAARGGQDSDQWRARIREVLVNNEVIVQEANRAGLTKKADVQVQLEMARQEVIVNNFVNEWISKHPISDAEIQTEYERAKSQTGSTEYKARHIPVQSVTRANKT